MVVAVNASIVAIVRRTLRRRPATAREIGERIARAKGKPLGDVMPTVRATLAWLAKKGEIERGKPVRNARTNRAAFTWRKA